MLKLYKLKDYKFKLIISLMALSILGVLVVRSAEPAFQNKQIMGVVLGFVIMLVLSLVDYSYILNFTSIMYVVNIVLLLSVRFLGTSTNGAQRWVEIAGIRFQPSELSKIIIILFFAAYFEKHKEDLNTVKTLAKTFLLAAIPLTLTLVQPALSTTLLTAITFCVLLYLAGFSNKIIVTVLAIIVPLFIIFFSIVLQPDQKLLENYQRNRIMAWLHPEEYPELTYQQTNSVVAIASGQLYGKGLNNDDVSSVKNANFIIEPQTDFIFAVIGEELGFVGCCIVIFGLAFVIFECIWIGRNAKDMSGRLICCGMGTLLMFQSFLNICVATQVLPNTGVPLPFISYGLTSLVSLYIGMGFVLNVGLQPKKY